MACTFGKLLLVKGSFLWLQLLWGWKNVSFHARGAVFAGGITLDNTVLGSRKLFNVLWQWQALAVLSLVELW